ncbi:MAG: plasmid pRiA4b ORF-3 family protein [Actinomycetota bacterium]
MSSSPAPVYQLRVTLREIEPPIWRRLQVPGTSTLAELHRVLQAAFGWWDYHLHEFEIAGNRYGTDDGEGWMDPLPLDERRVALGELVREGDAFLYLYDFGDDWEHEIEVEKALAPDPAQDYPVCLDGARARPPEDCGGPGGYERFLEAIGDPSNEEHESMLEWAAGSFDPQYFDPVDVSLNWRFGPVFTASAPPDDPVLQAPLEQMRADDPAAAKVAAAALGAATEGRGVDAISQHSLQRFLWDELPRQWTPDLQDQRYVVESLATLLELLEMRRYAELCRSEATAEVLRAYGRGEGYGVAACADAEQASGIRPPDLPELVWGMFPGEREAVAYARLSQMLELAVASGDLEPGARSWKRRQRELVEARLDMPQTELGGTTLRQAIQAERLQHWVNARGRAGRQILTGVLDRLQDPAPPPSGEELFPRLRWLLEQLAEGIPLTQSGNLGQKFVQGAAPRFGWIMRGLPRGEDELFDLRLTREFAQRARLARRQGRKMVATKRGRQVLQDPDALWRTVASYLLPSQVFDAFTGELALALLLEAEEMTRDDLTARIKQAAAERGFRKPATGAPPDDWDVSWALNETLRLGAVLDLLAVGRDWADRSYRLNDAGRATAAKALQLRAQVPRTTPYG